MQSLEADLYRKGFELWNMLPVKSAEGYCEAGTLYRFDHADGDGDYWVYFRSNLFAVNVFEMRFRRDGIMRYRHAEHLTIAYYDDVERTVQMTGGVPVPQSVAAYIADEGFEYVVRFLPGARIKAASITISPDYYRDYLERRFGGIPDIRRAFAAVSGRQDFPELAGLLKQARAYRGTGMAADLFFEGLVAETIGLVIRKASEIAAERREGGQMRLQTADRTIMGELARYIDTNLSGDLSTPTLARRACMGATKFKAAFRACYGTSPSAYVAERRMERALELVRETELPIATIAAQVGYRKAGAFTEAFRRTHGVAPRTFRQ